MHTGQFKTITCRDVCFSLQLKLEVNLHWSQGGFESWNKLQLLLNLFQKRNLIWLRVETKNLRITKINLSA